MTASLSASAPSTATYAACAPSSLPWADSPSRPSTVLVTALPSTRARLRLWMVFAAVGALALALLVGGLAWVRLYDDQLIRPPEDPPAPIVPPDPEARKAGDALNVILQRVRRSMLSGIRVLDARGVVVATSGTQLGVTYADREEVQRALRGEPNAVLRRRLRDPYDAPLASISRESGVRVWVAIPVIDDGHIRGAVLASRTPMTLAKVFYADRWNLVSTLLVLVSVLVLVSLAAAALILRPIRAVVRQAKAIAA